MEFRRPNLVAPWVAKSAAAGMVLIKILDQSYFKSSHAKATQELQDIVLAIPYTYTDPSYCIES